jgi:DNA-binding transcriptional ArsR family regulator
VDENRPLLTDPKALEALAHPVRLDLLTYLASEGPATASVCARAVGDDPSNCSYHLRALARHGLVERVESSDGRERPWRTTITGFRTADDGLDPASEQARGSGELMAAGLALDQRLARDYLARRDQVDPEWREVDQYNTYTLAIAPAELRELADKLDELIRPLIAATRQDAPADAEIVHLNVYAFPRTEPQWRRRPH